MWVARLLSVVSLLGLTGCGGGADEGGDGGASGGETSWEPTAGDQTFIDDFCNAVEPCCEPNGFQVSPDECRASLVRSGVSRDATLRAQCLAEMQELAASGRCVPDLADLDDPCVRVLDEPSGPRRPGQSCSVNADCAGSPRTSTICARAPTSSDPTASICASREIGQAGDRPCLGTVFPDGLILDYGLVLDGSDSPVSRGYICERGAGLYCDPTSRACTELVSGGGACTFEDSCASRICDDGSGVCRGIVSAGQSCEAAVCDAASDCNTELLCVAKAPAGSPCTVSDECEGTCFQGACRPINGAQLFVLTALCH